MKTSIFGELSGPLYSMKSGDFSILKYQKSWPEIKHSDFSEYQQMLIDIKQSRVGSFQSNGWLIMISGVLQSCNEDSSKIFGLAN